EHAVGRGERDLPGRCQACGDADHVRLRDSELEEPVRKRLAEIDRLDRFRRVRADHNDVRVAPTEIDERSAEVRSLALHLPGSCGQIAASWASSSARASFSSSSLVAAPWYLILFSMQATPLPFTVREIPSVGRVAVRCD